MVSSPTQSYGHELDIADSFASKSINRLRQDGIPPVPQNFEVWYVYYACLLYTSPSPRDQIGTRMQSSA